MKSKKTIIELFEANSQEFYEGKGIPRNIAYKVSRLEREFYKNLTEEQQLDYEDIKELESEKQNEINKNIFVYAYGLATRLIVEGLTGDKMEGE